MRLGEGASPYYLSCFSMFLFDHVHGDLANTLAASRRSPLSAAMGKVTTPLPLRTIRSATSEIPKMFNF